MDATVSPGARLAGSRRRRWVPRGERMAAAAIVAAVLTGGCGAAAPPAAATPETAAPSAASPAGSMSIWSPAIADGRLLPAYRCEPKVDGVEASIPLAWTGVPAAARSLAIAMSHHPDPADPTLVNGYLELWGIPPTVTGIARGEAGNGPWHQGANKDGVAVSYTSPCSRGSGTHTYVLELFALAETPASLPARSTAEVTYEVLAAAVESVPVLARATLVFTDTTP